VAEHFVYHTDSPSVAVYCSCAAALDVGVDPLYADVNTAIRPDPASSPLLRHQVAASSTVTFARMLKSLGAEILFTLETEVVDNDLVFYLVNGIG
jgi:hypothetical protein